MKYYIDITLLPDAETNLGFLWYKLYQQIHIMLVEHKVSEKDSAIALSFPKYACAEFPLGDKLRLFSKTRLELENLTLGKWLSRLEDYVHIKTISAVPSKVTEFRYFKRKQFKSPDKLRRDIDSRAAIIADKNGFDITEVKARLLASINSLDNMSKLPFINLRSLSTKSAINSAQQAKFLLFIECQKADKHSDGSEVFNCYGLSRRSQDSQASVPWF